MTRRLLIIPGAPLLVPELSGADADAAALRAAVLAAASRVLGASSADARPLIVRSPDDSRATAHVGSFRAWGADVTVGGGVHLPELVARWAIAQCGRDPERVEVSARLPEPFAGDGDAPIIVVADGPAALTARAPLTLLPEAEPIDEACADIAAGRFDAGAPFAGVDSAKGVAVGLADAEIWRDLAGFGAAVANEAGSFTAEASYRGAPHGVGYHVAEWTWLP
ncbi:hypothetical protein [uncultured Corynebacterium sp.]|uniref:hypothetical protein n=1 Tax=uncultured Corynebacterium sp. TaxID=159447 RepID=UPI0025E8DEFC|nr:hypothetical protein [uncultured Corynebacterium sp.]